MLTDIIEELSLSCPRALRPVKMIQLTKLQDPYLHGFEKALCICVCVSVCCACVFGVGVRGDRFCHQFFSVDHLYYFFQPSVHGPLSAI